MTDSEETGHPPAPAGLRRTSASGQLVPTATEPGVPVPEGQPPLLHGAVDFEIEPGGAGEPWHSSNGKIGVTVFASEANDAPSKRLGQVPALIFKENCIHKPMGPSAPVPFTYRSQTLIAELNGVFVHLVERDGKVAIVVADRRLEP